MHLSEYSYRLPSELGIIKSNYRKSLDVLVLSTFSLWGDALAEVWEAAGEETSLAVWPFYCASKDNKGDCLHGVRPAKSRLIPGCEWLEWARQVVEALNPRVVVVLTWGDHQDQDFAPLWGKRRVGRIPAAADVIALLHPAKDATRFREDWEARVTKELYERFLVGAKRTADGAIDAFAVLKHQRTEEDTPARPTAEAREEEQKLRAQEVDAFVTGDNILPEHWQVTGNAEEARKALDEAVERRKARAKQEALQERIARDRALGQQQLDGFFSSGGSDMRRRTQPQSAMQAADKALQRSAEAEARLQQARKAAEDFWADTPLPAPTPAPPAVPFKPRPASATLNLADEFQAAKQLEANTGRSFPVAPTPAQQDEAWAREVEERLAQEQEAAAPEETHGPQVAKGKYEDR